MAEEFRKKTSPENYKDEVSPYDSMAHGSLLDPDEYPESKYELDANKIKDFIKQYYLLGLEREVERKRGQITTIGIGSAYQNEVITNDITYLQEQIALIKAEK